MGRFLYATIWTTLSADEGHFKSAIDGQNPSAQAVGKLETASTTGGAGKGDSLSKKSSGILCEGNRLVVYGFIQANHPEFGLRWLLRKFNTRPNAYYIYLRHRKKGHRIRKEEICAEIEQTYHDNNGNYGSRFIRVLFARKGIYRCRNTVRKYLNVELGLKAIVRRKKMKYAFFGEHHVVFENLVNRKFEAEYINKVWCTDFTYIKLSAWLDIIVRLSICLTARWL